MGNDDPYVNKLFLLPGWNCMAAPAKRLVMKYDQRLYKVLEHTGVTTESEVMAGLIDTGRSNKYQSKNFHDIEERQEQLAEQVWATNAF